MGRILVISVAAMTAYWYNGIMTTKATLYLDTDLYKAIKLRAVQTGQSISGLMNEALQAQLSEDLEDISAIQGRLKGQEEVLSYDSALAELKRSGRI